MSLLFPAYLLGLLGLLLPWLLHRFSDQQPTEELFPSHKFLEETKPPVSRTRTLKYRALLAIRILSVLLLCFLFAQPWLNNATDIGDAKMHHIIAMDQSLSMRATGRWDSALTRGRELIDQYGESHSVELIGFDRSVLQVADNASAKADLVRGLATMQPGYMAADYGVLMQRLNKLASERTEPVKIWIVSDQQRTAMPAQQNTLFAPKVKDFAFLSVLSEPQRNVHLRAQAHSVDGVNVRVSVQLSASVSGQDSNAPSRNFTDNTAEDNASEELIRSTVVISFNGEILARRAVGIAPSGQDSVFFDDLIMPPGDAPVLSVSVEETDALVLDNTLAISIKRADPTVVASLQSDNLSSPNSLVFISTALEAESQAKVVASSGTAEQIASSVLQLVTGRDLSQDRLDLDIRQFVDQGKNALVFSNAKPSKDAALIVKGAEIGLVDESHPLALGDIDWFGTEFYDVPPVALSQGDRVLIETTLRQAILVERQAPNGTILLLNDRLDGQSSNLPFQPAFVTLMKSIVEYFDTNTAIPDQLLVGERLLVSGNVQLLDPDNTSLLSLDGSQRQGGVALNKPGFYKVVGLRGQHIVSVELDAEEADITTADADTLTNWQNKFEASDAIASNDSAQNPSKSGGQVTDPRAERSRAKFWLWLLPVLAAAFLIELVLANRRLDVTRDGT